MVQYSGVVSLVILIGVMEINMKTLPEHYSDYFYESLLAEAPEAFLGC